MIPPFRREFDAARDPDTARYALGIPTFVQWTPTLTFTTPGDLSVTYGTRTGLLISIGKLKFAFFNIDTTAFTYTTASGAVRITGLPVSGVTAPVMYGVLGQWRGITKAGFTDLSCQISTNILFVVANASASVPSAVSAADMPTGGTVNLRGQITFQST